MKSSRRQRTALRIAAWMCVSCMESSAQVPLQWEHVYVLPEAWDSDCGTFALAATPSGVVYACLYTGAPQGATRFVKLGESGNLAWSKKFGPSSSMRYRAAFVDAADNVTFVGTRAATEVVALSLAPDGSLRWLESFTAGVASATVFAQLDATQQRSLSVFVEAVGTQRTRVLLRDASGTLLASPTFELNPTGSESIRDLCLDAAGNAVVCGTAGALGVVAKLSPSGAILWQHTADGALQLGAAYEHLACAADGSIVALGTTNVAGGSKDTLTTLFDAAGSVQWTVEADAGFGGSDSARDVAFASDGSVWSVGHAQLASASSLFVARHERGSGAVERATGSTATNWFQPAFALPTSAGQVWIAASVYPGPQTQTRAELVLFDYLPGQGIAPRHTTGRGDGTNEFHIEALISAGQRIHVGGRTDMPTALGVFFDPIAWNAQFDARGIPTGYCSAQANSLGCRASLTCSGLPRAGAASGFQVTASDLLDHRVGLFVYGTSGAANAPFQGGTLCVAPPLRRTPLLDTGGTTSTSGVCSGALILDWSAFTSGTLGGAPAPELALAGTAVHLQAWSRDAQASSSTNLSGALRYTVLP
ncbi:MAG: hypothetical protein IT454_07630 [Planctomycetes bacterium]|nr:hypothetical protein [Planctomycetota bacterium]